MGFTSPDNDNDRYGNKNCAVEFQSAWWFKGCLTINFNGPYSSNGTVESRQGIIWKSWTGENKSLKEVKMLIRRMNE